MSETDTIKRKAEPCYVCYGCDSIGRRGIWVNMDKGILYSIANTFEVIEQSCPDCLESDVKMMYDDLLGPHTPLPDSKKPYSSGYHQQ